jgi:hypothetical protein
MFRVFITAHKIVTQLDRRALLFAMTLSFGFGYLRLGPKACWATVVGRTCLIRPGHRSSLLQWFAAASK